jgi:5'-nucleotidase
MRILISNDDGINAKGLQVLESIAAKISDDVWVVAPELDQSGSSHSLTLREPLRIRQHGPKRFSVGGTPSDCVLTGISYILRDKRPDLVLSGVNNGCNLGEDIIYSGTVAAAIEAKLLKVNAIAFSLGIENKRLAQWDVVEHFVPSIIHKLSTLPNFDDIIYNVNFPNVALDQVKGIRITDQGRRTIVDEIVERVDPRGNPYYWIGPASHRYDDIWQHAKPSTDLEAIAHKKISITPLNLNLTHEPTKKLLEDLF